MAFVRSCYKLPLCHMEPMPAGSKMDPPVAKAEPSSDGGGASGITYLRREKKLLCNSNCSWREERKHVRETTLQTSRSVKKEWEEMLQAPEQRFPCSPW